MQPKVKNRYITLTVLREYNAHLKSSLTESNPCLIETEMSIKAL